MSKNPETPELFNNPKKATLHWREELVVVKIPITPDGAYFGNGEYKVTNGDIFQITEVDKRNGRTRWFGKGYIKVETDFGGY